MVNQLLKCLNGNDELRKNLDIFKEAFIEYYGEDKRDFIESKFQNMLPIGYLIPDEIQRILSKIEDAKATELLSGMLDGKNIPLQDKDLFGDGVLNNFKSHPIYSYSRFYEDYKLGKNGRIEKFHRSGFDFVSRYLKDLTYEEFLEIVDGRKTINNLSSLPYWIRNNIEYYLNDENAENEYNRNYALAEKLMKKVVPNITLESFESYEKDGYFNELNLISYEYVDACNKYMDFINSLKEFYDLKDTIEKNKSDLNEKYKKMLIEEFIFLIPEDKRNGIYEYLRGENKHVDSYVDFLFGSNIKMSSILEAFSEESNKKLSDESVSYWVKKNIMFDRIRFFNKNGFDLGDNYDDYCQNMDAQKIVPNVDVITRFLKRKEELLDLYNREFYKKAPFFEKISSVINSLDFLVKDDSLNVDLYYKKICCVMSNLRRMSSGLDVYPILLINFDASNLYCLDHTIVHELNHLYESSLMRVSDNDCTFTCGWEFFYEEFKQDKSDNEGTINFDDKREYELFNEIINELIAQDICQIMHKNKWFVFGTEKDSKYKGMSSYEHSLFLVREFFSEYKQEIIESRCSGNISIIWNTVGKENFDELNSLFKIYDENFSGFKFYKLFDDLQNGKDTELTRVYYELVERKKEILNNMRAYKESSLKSVGR